MDPNDIKLIALDRALKLVSQVDGGNADAVIADAKKFVTFLEGA